MGSKRESFAIEELIDKTKELEEADAKVGVVSVYWTVVDWEMGKTRGEEGGTSARFEVVGDISMLKGLEDC